MMSLLKSSAEWISEWTSTMASKIKLKVLSTSMTSSESSSTSSKKLIEYIIHIHIWISTSFLLSNTLFSKLIISFPFFWIRQHFICVCQLLEFLLCSFRIILIFIRMVFNCQFLKLFFYFLVRCISFYSQKLIIILAFFLIILWSSIRPSTSKATSTKSRLYKHIISKRKLIVF